MGSSILNVGQSALTAAQIGLTTTGHNIANANTPGYSRQVVVQASAGAQNTGTGFVGKGTSVVTVKRIYSEYLNNQVLSSQTSKNSVDSYFTQISQIDNMLADSTAGVSPALQDFFNGVQAVASNANLPGARDTMLSSANALVARFQSIDARLDEMRQGVNTQLASSISDINSYATQIAQLNDAIEKAQGQGGADQPPNDLLDQRDQLLSDLSKEVKVSVVKQGNSYNVFIGNGQPLVMNNHTYQLVQTVSANDRGRAEVGFIGSDGSLNELPENMLTGGTLGGVLEFRSKTLDPVQNALGRMATGLALTFNAQHKLGQDLNGAAGTDFFKIAAPVVNANAKNAGDEQIKVDIVDGSALTDSDYRLEHVAGNYVLTRLSDGQQLYSGATLPSTTIDGLNFSHVSGAIQDGDSYVIQPTVNGAGGIGVAISDTSKIAAAAPALTSAAAANTGSGKISLGSVASTALIPGGITLNYDATLSQLNLVPAQSAVTVTSGGTAKTYPAGAANIPFAPGDTLSIAGIPVTIPTAATASFTLASPTATTLTYDAATGNLSGFPAYQDIVVTHADGSKQTYAGASPAPAIPYTDGDSFSVGGVSFAITGTPGNGDQFVIGPNPNGKGDNRNAVQLAAMQTANTLVNGTTSYQSVYAQIVSTVGSKTHELDVANSAQDKMLESAVTAQQAQSGVNLDEEAANLLRYQQAYQAAAKMMQTAGQLFDMLLQMGG